MHKAKESEKNERRRRQTEIAINKILLLYQIGLSLHKELPLNGELKQLYESLHSDTKAKVKRFAKPDSGGYTRMQLDELVKLCMDGKKPFPLGFKLIERLLSIPFPQRDRLQRLMVKKGWRRRELDHQIALIRPNNSWKGGRQVERLRSARGVLPELWHMSKEWADRANSITSHYSNVLNQLTEADRNRFVKATAMIQKLRRSLAVHLRKPESNS